MDQYEKAKEFILSKYANIYNETLRIEAISHTMQVDSLITLLAISRGYKYEKAKIAALFHDYAQYIDNCPHSQHAKLSSLYAHKYLHEQKLLKIHDIDDICFAISQHSKKDQEDSPLCELLKDADCLARFLEDPSYPLDKARKKRVYNALKDIDH